MTPLSAPLASRSGPPHPRPCLSALPASVAPRARPLPPFYRTSVRPAARTRAFSLPPLLLTAALAAAPVRARPLMPAPPLGATASAFAGGGVAHAAGVGSLFGNPAAVSVKDAFQAEAGLMGLTSGLSPYALFGAAGAERSSYALGYWYDRRPGDPATPAEPRQGLMFGASWEASPWASLGAAVKSASAGGGVGGDGFGIDADLGALLRAWKSAWLGLALRDAMESGVGHDPEGFRTRRVWAAAVGTEWPSARLLGIRFREPDAHYELSAHGRPPTGAVNHAVSLASSFLPGGRLGFRATLALPQQHPVGFAWATTLNLPAGRGALALAYVVHAGGSAETAETGLSHSLSLNLRMGGRLDPLPPELAVEADRARLTAGDSAFLYFRLQARDLAYVRGKSETGVAMGQDRWGGRRPALHEGRSLAEGRIRAWSLTVAGMGEKGLAGAPLRVFQGKDLPPRVIRWEADDAAGRKLPAGYYAFRLEAEDMAGNVAATSWQLIRIEGAGTIGTDPKP